MVAGLEPIQDYLVLKDRKALKVVLDPLVRKVQQGHKVHKVVLDPLALKELLDLKAPRAHKELQEALVPLVLRAHRELQVPLDLRVPKV
jgi:hypothetical protein